MIVSLKVYGDQRLGVSLQPSKPTCNEVLAVVGLYRLRQVGLLGRCVNAIRPPARQAYRRCQSLCLHRHAQPNIRFHLHPCWPSLIALHRTLIASFLNTHPYQVLPLMPLPHHARRLAQCFTFGITPLALQPFIESGHRCLRFGEVSTQRCLGWPNSLAQADDRWSFRSAHRLLGLGLAMVQPTPRLAGKVGGDDAL
jgi:hypothetical protein